MMRRKVRRVVQITCAVLVAVGLRSPSAAVFLDQGEPVKLGVRALVDTRIGTEATHNGVPLAVPSGGTISASGTFPESAAGHVRQIRSFVEAEFNHDIDGLVKRGVGPFSLLDYLPFKLKDFSYHLT